MNGVVLSLPPIINGDHSKITLATKNVLIEVTGTDYTKSMMGLTNIVCAFSTYSANKFEIEQVKVVYEDGKEDVTPHLECHSLKVKLDYMSKLGGFTISREEAIKILDRMGYNILGGEGNEIEVQVPLFRSGIDQINTRYPSPL